MKKKIIFFALFALMVCALSVSVSAWTCPDCGVRYNDDTTWECPDCLYTMTWQCSCENELYITEEFCENCGDERYMYIERDAEYCAYCTATLDEEGYCDNCGDYTPFARFCGCGTVLTLQRYEMELDNDWIEFDLWFCEDCGTMDIEGVSPSAAISALIQLGRAEGGNDEEYDEGYALGYEDGYYKGCGDGYDNGYLKGHQDGVASVPPPCDGSSHLMDYEDWCDCYKDGYDSGYLTGYWDGRDSANEGGGIEDEILNREYQAGYTAGYTAGVNEGKATGEQACADKNHDAIWQKGYSAGTQSGHINDMCEISYSKGFREGKSAGIEEDVSGSFIECVGEIAFAPYRAVSTMFDFEIFGLNVAGVIFELFTVVILGAVAVFIVKLFI